MSLSILIVEDEVIIADDLALSLEDMGYSVFGQARNYEEALDLISNEKPDIAILDIILEGEKTGIDLAEKIKEKNIPFLFLTSMYDRATVEKVNRTSPLGYVVKPFKESDLRVALQLAWRRSKHSDHKNEVSVKPLFVRKDGMMVSLKPVDIMYVEADDNYSNIYSEKEKYVVSQTLKNVEKELEKAGFFRVHKTYLVNLSKIDLIEHSVIFIGQKSIPIGKSYRKEFLERITVF